MAIEEDPCMCPDYGSSYQVFGRCGLTRVGLQRVRLPGLGGQRKQQHQHPYAGARHLRGLY